MKEAVADEGGHAADFCGAGEVGFLQEFGDGGELMMLVMLMMMGSGGGGAGLFLKARVSVIHLGPPLCCAEPQSRSEHPFWRWDARAARTHSHLQCPPLGPPVPPRD